MSRIESNADERTASEPVHRPTVALNIARDVAVAMETLVANTLLTLISPPPLSVFQRN
jgi:hypothetical protein